MKTFNTLLLTFFIGYTSLAQNLDAFFDQSNNFFIQNVTDGKVDYESVKESKKLTDPCWDALKNLK